MPSRNPTEADRVAAIATARRGELLSAWEMAAIFGLSESRFYQRVKAGAFDAFRVKPQIGAVKFSGVLVARYLDGEPVFQPIFGRKRA
jgi:hypothetical protein